MSSILKKNHKKVVFRFIYAWRIIITVRAAEYLLACAIARVASCRVVASQVDTLGHFFVELRVCFLLQSSASNRHKCFVNFRRFLRFVCRLSLEWDFTLAEHSKCGKSFLAAHQACARLGVTARFSRSILFPITTNWKRRLFLL